MYIGNDLQIAHPSYKIIDDISSGFNGSTTSFALQVSGATPVPFPISTQQVMISVNGVVQEPDPTGSAGFKLLGSNIVFSSAPANGHAFFGVINAGADYVTAGSEFPDGSATAPSFTFQDDQDTGWYRNASGDVGYSSNGSAILNFDGNGLTIAGGKGLTVDTSTLKVDAANNRVGIGTASPSNTLDVQAGTTNTAIVARSTDSKAQISLVDNSTTSVGSVVVGAEGDNLFLTSGSGGTERMRIDSSGKVGIGETSMDALLVIKGDSDANTTPSIRLKDGSDTREAWISNTAGDLVLANGGDDNTPHCELKMFDGNIMRFNTANTERMRIDSSGRLLVGHTATIDTSTYNSNLQVMGTDAHGSSTVIGRFSNDAGAPSLHLTKSRNTTKGSHTIVNDNDVCGNIFWWASDGSDYEQVAQIGAEIDGTPGSGDTPGALTFSTTADGASTSTEALRLDSSQNATFAGRLIGAKAGNSALSTPSLELYGSQSGATFGDLRVHNWGDSNGDYWQINSNLGLDSNGNTDKVDDSKKGAGITIDGRAGRIFLKTSHDGTSATNDVLIADSSGNATFGGTVSDSKGNLRSIPLNGQNGAYTLVAADAGKAVDQQNGGWTVNNSVFSAGDAVTLINNSGSDMTITQGSGLTIYNTADGTTGNRTLAGRGMATIYFVSASNCYISGAGLS